MSQLFLLLEAMAEACSASTKAESKVSLTNYCKVYLQDSQIKHFCLKVKAKYYLTVFKVKGKVPFILGHLF